MADKPEQSEKTEEPTTRKLEKAREEGNVPKSQDVNTFIILVGVLLVVTLLAPEVSTAFVERLMIVTTNAFHLTISGTPGDFFDFMGSVVSGVALAIGTVLIFFVVVSIGASFLQGAVTFAPKAVMPKLSNISPASGFKRLFSLNSLVELVKNIVKFITVGAAVALVIYFQFDNVLAASANDFATMPEIMREIIIEVLLAILIVLMVIAAADLLFQRWNSHRELKMTRQEVKDEHRQMEGDPQVKRRLAKLRSERSRQRMMAAVPDATAVVTNPTHYAVALKYEPDDDVPAPICVAKGVDYLALSIKEVAEEHDIPIIENPPLARTLYNTTELDEPIPEDHYQAVAEIIIFVYRQRERRVTA
jgi:flagellar biosynthetic protein FlhB